MSRWGLTFEVARWEFTRFYKIKNELKSAAIMLLFGIIGGVVGLLIGSSHEKPEIAIINKGNIVIDSTLYDHFVVHHAEETDEELWKIRVGEKDAEGLVIISSVDEGEIYVRHDRHWILHLEQIFTDLRRQTIIMQSDISAETADRIFQPFTLSTSYHDLKAAEGRTVERVFVIGFIVAMLAAIFIGFAYQFTSITGEKQQRVTEQIITAIPPQMWIDGKIIGITAIGLASILFYGGIILVLGLAFAQFFGPGFLMPLAHVSVWKILSFLFLSMMGILLWNSFLAAIAATISDPNTSERSALMMLPTLPVGLAFASLLNPDSIIVKFLGVFPLTSSSMLPVRMVLTEVYLWEFILAVVLLGVAIWLFRIAAGKIFALGMLMYGKEPGFAEMWRWIRETHPKISL